MDAVAAAAAAVPATAAPSEVAPVAPAPDDAALRSRGRTALQALPFFEDLGLADDEAYLLTLGRRARGGALRRA